MEAKKQLEEAMDFCLSEAKKAKSSEDSARYISEYVKLTNALIEIEKNESEIELERTKFEDSKNDNFRWFEILATFLSSLSLEAFRSWVLWKQTKRICYFEQNDTFTTSAGKGLAKSLNLGPIMSKRDH